MLDVMTAKTKLMILAGLLALLATVAGFAATVGHSDTVSPAGLRAADQFAADFTSPNGIDSNNRISAGADTTPQVAAEITKTLQGNNAHSAGFTITGPAAPTKAAPFNVTVPTDHGPWKMQVTNRNGRWLVSKA